MGNNPPSQAVWLLLLGGLLSLTVMLPLVGWIWGVLLVATLAGTLYLVTVFVSGLGRNKDRRR